jgi:hypothetical protein
MLLVIPGTARPDDDLREENERLRQEVEELRQREAEKERALGDLCADLRSLITPVSGYLQAIARHRPLAAKRPVDALIERDVLPRVDDLTRAVDRLVEPPLCHRGRRRS